VNLPARLRRTTPRYQGRTSDGMPTITGDRWALHLAAGELFGQHGPAETHTPVLYAILTLEPDASVSLPVADGHTALVYVIDGTAEVGPGHDRVDAQHLAVLDRSSGDILLAAHGPDPLRCLVLAGEPIDEPMERYGPFVMNTVDELQEAIDDFNAGRMGQIPAAGGVTRVQPRPKAAKR